MKNMIDENINRLFSNYHSVYFQLLSLNIRVGKTIFKDRFCSKEHIKKILFGALVALSPHLEGLENKQKQG